MRGRDFENLARKYVLPHVSGITLRRGLLYLEPVGYLLRGFAVDSSAFSRWSMYLVCFIQPLYVPADHLRFNFGFRLRDPKTNRDGWQVDEEGEEHVFAAVLQAIREQGLPMLDKYREPADLERWPDARDGIHQAQSVAYGLILGGKVRDADKWLARVEQLGRDDGRDWAVEIGERARDFRVLLKDDDDRAVQQLRTWTHETARALGLTVEGVDA